MLDMQRRTNYLTDQFIKFEIPPAGRTSTCKLPCVQCYFHLKSWSRLEKYVGLAGRGEPRNRKYWLPEFGFSVFGFMQCEGAQVDAKLRSAVLYRACYSCKPSMV